MPNADIHYISDEMEVSYSEKVVFSTVCKFWPHRPSAPRIMPSPARLRTLRKSLKSQASFVLLRCTRWFLCASRTPGRTTPHTQIIKEQDQADDHNQVLGERQPLAVQQMSSYTRNFINMPQHMKSHICTKFE